MEINFDLSLNHNTITHNAKRLAIQYIYIYLFFLCYYSSVLYYGLIQKI